MPTSFTLPTHSVRDHALLTPDGQFLVAPLDNPRALVWDWRVDTQEVAMHRHGANHGASARILR